MPGPAFLTGDSVTLRGATPDDADFVAEQWNRPQIRRYTHQHDPQTADEVRGWLEEEQDDFIDFLPCRDGDSVGFAWAFDIDDVAGSAEIGYWIRETDRDNGYATETVELLAEWAFHDRGLHRLQARVFDGNDASERVLEKVGFEREGIVREAYCVAGDRVDATIFGLLAHEF